MLIADTNVVIRFGNGDRDIEDRLAALAEPVRLSAITLAELEAGVRATGDGARERQVANLVSAAIVLPFDEASALAFGRIIAASGYSRRKVIDRLIAATALVHGATLATCNPGDFADIPGLAIEAW